MEFNISQLSVRDRHKLLSALVLPRPIAWVTSMSSTGEVNAAPFSFFNLMGSDPAIVVLGIGNSDRGADRLKAGRQGVLSEAVLQVEGQRQQGHGHARETADRSDHRSAK